MPTIPPYVLSAIKSGPIPKVRNWRAIADRAQNPEQLEKRLTLAELTMYFIENFLKVPEGALQGQPIKLDIFQEVFIYAVYDNPAGTRRAYLSMARKNAKTATIAMLLICQLCGPPAQNLANAQIISGAMSREQAALVYALAEKMINMSDELSKILRTVQSRKSITNVYRNIEYRAISAEATTAHGLSPVLAILDEIGQVVGPNSPFVDAVTTAQGAYDEPLLIAISTSAASDADLFSIWCDDSERSDDAHTVSHIYKADEGCDLLDKTQWLKANPALGKFRGEIDLSQQLNQAARLPSMESTVRNLLLNQRVARQSIWLAPAIWKANNTKPNLKIFKKYGAYIGLDLSQKNDLTAAVMACKDEDNMIHLWPFCFTPLNGIDERGRRDRVPYSDWVRDGLLIGVPGATIDYDYVASFLKMSVMLPGIEINSVEFDRHRIPEFRAACDRGGVWASAWNEVGQGYVSMGPRIEAFETALLQNRIKHGNHPALNLGAAHAIATKNPVGDRKLDKSKASQKIDALVAAVMAAYPLISQTGGGYGGDVSHWIV